MNISEAKEYIKNTVNIYLKKDEYGDYRIPVVRQRPVFLLGAPGIGKTAIMEQIASELDIALVSYSMTHHTRQSALGLPFIAKKEYGGNTYDVSEYTMSEIIASVYETMEESGIKEGILFLDEINCVSETLAPSMLQFLQYKVFGRHQVPEGWVIVTAGNPVEFNKSVREFDVVTLDRLKVLEVEADYPAWKVYAKEKGIHATVLNFLDANKEYFYNLSTTADGVSYVTARGWEDLSDIIYLYEESKLRINENLVSQYLHNDKIVREFAAYYDLFNKYKTDYQVDALLDGKVREDVFDRAKAATLDERLALVGLLLNKINSEIKAVMNEVDDLKQIAPSIKTMKESVTVFEDLKNLAEARTMIIANKQRAGSLTSAEKNKNKRIEAFYRKLMEEISKGASVEDILSIYNGRVVSLKDTVGIVQNRLHNLILFSENTFGDESNELLVLITELTMGKESARFLNMFGSEDYDRCNSILMVTDRFTELRNDVLNLL